MINYIFFSLLILFFILCLKNPAYGVPFIAFSLPFREPSIFILGPIDLKITELLVVTAGIALLFRHLYLREKITLVGYKFFIPFYIFLVVGVASLFVTYDHLSSLAEIMRYFFIGFMVLLFSASVQSKKHLKNLITSLLASGLIVQVAGLAGLIFAVLTNKRSFLVFFTGYRELAGFPFRVVSFLRDPNFYSSFIIIIFFISFVLALSYRKPGYYFLASLSAISLLLAFSRGAWLGVLAGLSIILFYFFKTKESIHYIRRFIIFIVFILIFFLPIASHYGLLPAMAKRISEISIAGASPRIGDWQAGLRMVEKNPLLGVGIGAYKTAHLKYYLPSENPRYRHLEAHDTFLDILASTGLLGFIPWFFALLAVFNSGRRNIEVYMQNKSDYKFQYNLSVAIFTAFIALIVQGMTINMSTVRHFWLLVAIILILARLRKRKGYEYDNE